MKMKSVFQTIALPCVLFLFVLSPGCREKGCTDASALNYNQFAKSDDGSCLYCEVLKLQTDQVVAPLVDQNFSSPYYSAIVANFHYRHESIEYNYSSCGSSKCEIYFQIENETDKQLTFTYSIRGSVSGSFFQTTSLTAVVPPWQTTALDSILDKISFSSTDLCGTLNSTNVELHSNISYN